MSNERFTDGDMLNRFKKLIYEEKHNVSILLKFLTVLIVVFMVSTATADVLSDKKSFCNKKALIKAPLSEKLQLNSEYDKAILSIAKLPEFLQVKNDISMIDKRNSMHFDSGRDEQYETADGKCYWEVTVYVNREDENQMVVWHMFLVDGNGKVEFIKDLEGDYIPLLQWRSSNVLK